MHGETVHGETACTVKLCTAKLHARSNCARRNCMHGGTVHGETVVLHGGTARCTVCRAVLPSTLPCRFTVHVYLYTRRRFAVHSFAVHRAQFPPCTVHRAPCTVYRAPCTVHQGFQIGTKNKYPVILCVSATGYLFFFARPGARSQIFIFFRAPWRSEPDIYFFSSALAL